MQFATDLLQRCWFLAGPTASGKSEAGVCLAERLRAEIVSLDSMSLYRGMDIGTAKPPLELRRRVPHHLIDVLEPHEEYSVAEYVSAAETICREIVARGRIPLFVGGTGLYLRAVLRGVFAGPPADWAFRRRLEAEARAREPDFLHHRLLEVDPSAAAVLHPRDTRRLIRALEVHYVTGRPLSEQQRQLPLPPGERPPHVYWLSPPRDWLSARINRRVEEMIAAGLVEEVRRLLAAPKPPSHTARQALGYREISEWLGSGQRSAVSGQLSAVKDQSSAVRGQRSELRSGAVLPMAEVVPPRMGHGQLTTDKEQRTTDKQAFPQVVERIQTRTRQFAKRQHTWFRNLEECTPIPMTGSETPAELAGRVIAVATR
jgi:tRNA dimethylallyltransferase